MENLAPDSLLIWNLIKLQILILLLTRYPYEWLRELSSKRPLLRVPDLFWTAPEFLPVTGSQRNSSKVNVYFFFYPNKYDFFVTKKYVVICGSEFDARNTQ